MAITVDKKKTALLSMDFQNDIIHPDAALAQAAGFANMVEKTGILDKSAALLAQAREAGMLVIHIIVEFGDDGSTMPTRGAFFKMLGAGGPTLQPGTWGAEIHEKVAPKDGDLVIKKTMISAFVGSNLKEVLDENGITDIAMIGVATPFVIEGTTWSAVDLGVNCIVIEDCVCAGDEASHQAAIDTSLTYLSDICSAEEFVTAIS
ncbi:MAG: cysteine hydrolase [Immundisolibacteraceae bacterium]|nr:cysteine hydrolase [Immundisolibacteraceae bacterium]